MGNRKFVKATLEEITCWKEICKSWRGLSGYLEKWYQYQEGLEKGLDPKELKEKYIAEMSGEVMEEVNEPT